MNRIRVKARLFVKTREVTGSHSTASYESIIAACKPEILKLQALPLEEKIECMNRLRALIHQVSPFASEPVDLVQWVPSSDVWANDYNPNTVAPPEMELLATSIKADGYTQPIVGYLQTGGYEVVDGFHRHRVGKENREIRSRIHGYLPIVGINADRQDKGDRIASTIRHNRARGKHKVEAMSDIVVELKRRNWSDEKIAKNLGMDADEVLRLCQITGLADVFGNDEFSKAWEVSKGDDVGGELISDVLEDFVANDGDRVLHTWEKWECFKAGFYAERPPNGMTQEEGEMQYSLFLSDLGAFEKALGRVTSEWKYSCEHYLTNERMNRIAWLGQASVALAKGIPSGCRGGFMKLNQQQRDAANALALKWLNKWLTTHGRKAVTFEQAGGRTEAELY